MKSNQFKISKNYLKVFAIRFLIVNIVYFLVKLTINHQGDQEPLFDPTGIFYYMSAFFLLMFSWELNDWSIRREVRKNLERGLDLNNGIKILLINILVCIPVIAIVYYLAIFEFNHICEIDADNPWLQFRIDFFRAIILGFSAILFNMFYYALRQKKELENSVNKLKKEVVTSKYKSLKSQISPHFLFNSLNTLTSLMYEDRDLASDFVSRLASCYRYILDNREEDLVSLEKELSFLDSFIFMMNVRHEGALDISTDIRISPKDYVIPILTLQMLVENALKHNYYSKEKPLKVSIIGVDDHKILIQNNIHIRKQKEESTKLGLKNIQNRYAFYTNQKVIIETENGFFKVIIPLLNKDLKEIPVIKVS